MGIAHSEETHQGFLTTMYYWLLLLVTLVVLDDLTFGWIFWGLGLISPVLSAATALVIYWAVGYWLVREGLKPVPHRLASWWIKRLQMERKNPEVGRREQQLQYKITSVVVAVPMALLFGGVLTVLWLNKRAAVRLSNHELHRLGFWLAGLYACEFAALHGLGIGGGLFQIFR